MIVYEVNLRVDSDVAAAFRAWLASHVRDMLALPGFVSAEIFRVEAATADKLWSVHYRLRDRTALEAYLSEHAPRMRADGQARFGGRFSADRRILLADPDPPGRA